MAQVTQAQGSNSPFSRVAVAQPAKGQAIKLIAQLPVNASFASNVRIQTGDTDPGIAAPFARRIPGGCFADFDLKEDVLKKFRGSSGNGKLTFSDSTGHEVAVPISFNGFAQAFDALVRE
jgi:invasion protein IalB